MRIDPESVEQVRAALAESPQAGGGGPAEHSTTGRAGRCGKGA
jgi:hypothetical protein